MSSIEEQSTLSLQPDEEEILVAEHKKRRHRRKGPRWFRRIRKQFGPRVKLVNLLLIFVAILVVVGIAAVALVTDANNRVQLSLASLDRVLTSFSSRSTTELTAVDFERLQSSVNELVSTLAGARQQIFFLRPFASLHPDLKTTLTTLDAAQSLSFAARDILTGLQPTLFLLVSGDSGGTVAVQNSSGERMVELLRIGRPRFSSAENYLQTARTQLNSINLTSVSPQRFLDVQDLIAYADQLTDINQMLQQAPELLTEALGLSGERSYLVLSQNSDELRPSGGYISTFGWMTVRNGRVVDYSYSPTTATSPNPPASDLSSEVQVPDWWINYNQPLYAAWDGSWYADFPSTAEMAMWYYDNGHNPQSPVSGVIAIDMAGFEAILGALGSVAVPGYDVVVTPENFRQVVYDIRAFGEGDLPHKRFLAALYRQIFADWQEISYDPARSTRFFNVLLQALREKHIMLYMHDESLNQAIDLLGWTGAQTPTRGEDYLMVADANLGNKSNHSIARQLIYDVAVQEDGTAQSRVTVAYDYSARRASTDPAVNPEYHGPLDYNNLLQVFVPSGSFLTDTDNLVYAPQIVTSEGATVLVSQVTVPYDTGERFQYTYSPGTVSTPIGDYFHYRLLIQKQPGTRADTVNVQVTLPAQATVIHVSPEPSASYILDQPILEFQFPLLADQQIEVIYRLNG